VKPNNGSRGRVQIVATCAAGRNDYRLSNNEDNMSTELQKMMEGFGSLERPADLSPDQIGTENIDIADIRLPRLAISQGLSPQMMPDNPKFIDGLRLFEMFNTVTGEVYGKGPIAFIPVRRDVVRIEFRPRSEGGGIVDFNVPPTDPRCKWTEGPDPEKPCQTKRFPPKATKFTEFVIMLLRNGAGNVPKIETLVLSIKDTNKMNREAADKLTTLIVGKQAAIYAGLYTIGAGTDKNDKGTFGVYVVNNAGFANSTLRAQAEALYNKIKDKKIETDRDETEGEGDTSFDTDAMEREAAAQGSM